MFVLVLLQIFGYFSICYAQCNISQQEYLGLESFFYASNGPFWTIPNKESAWTFPAQLSEPCNQPWAGLTCMMQGFDCVVTELTLNGFSLRGSISSDLTMLQGLVVLDLGNNDLNSTIPDVLNQFSGLKVILLNDNDLTGTVPMLPKSVEQFVLNNNNLGGHLDVFCSWGVYSNITVVDIASNDFSGTISSCFHDSVFPQIQTLAFGQNHISGSLPDELFSLTSLLTLDVSYNMLDGGLSGLRDLAQLTTLEAWNNLFTGSYLSSTTGNYWISLLLYKNYLSGTLSSSLSNSNNSLRALNVGYNFMSGTLPSTLSILLRMETFNITHNSFHGQISQLFPDTANVTFPLLNAIDLSDNYFTGTLPDGVFDDHPFLTTVVIYNNCMHGSLPSAICEADVLTALVLDGITTRVCHRVQQAVLRLVSNGGLEGEIPSCIWQMPSLEVLHLSGNGLVGNLGDILKTSALVDVSLSNNLLAGTIPYSWQTYGKFKSLLLSSNRIHGTLSPDFAFLDSSDIQLAINRLSGTIPQSLMNVQDINILNGNSFQCMAGQLPKNDPKAKGYVCGSDNLDAALVLTFGGVGCLLLLTAVALYRKFAILTKVLSNYHLFDSVLLGEYQKRSALLQVYNFNGYIRRFLWVASVFGLVVCMPWYVALKLQPEWSEKYSFHTFNYAWIISPAYLRGLVPTWLVTLQIAIVGYMFSTYFGDGLAAVTGFASINQDSKCASISNWPAEACKAFVLIVFHCVVMFVINAAYIYAVVEEVSTGALTAVQIALNAMKLGWEFLFVQWSLENTNISSKEKLMMSAFMSLFTFIISPLLVTFFTDPRCFEYTVTGVPSLSLTYQTPPYSYSIVPAWFYSYQCSSALIVNYVPVLLQSQFMTGFGIPIAKLLYSHWPERQSAVWFGNGLFARLLHAMPSIGVGSAMSVLTSDLVAVGICTTFGLAYPPLIVVVAVGRWVVHSTQKAILVQYVNDPNSSVLTWDKLSRLYTIELRVEDKSIWVLALIIAHTIVTFWGLLIFDMISDQSRNQRGISWAVTLWAAANLRVATIYYYTVCVSSTNEVENVETAVKADSSGDAEAAATTGSTAGVNENSMVVKLDNSIEMVGVDSNAI